MGDIWSGRIWGRTGCDFDNGAGCETGDCGRVLECKGATGEPPASLAELTFSGGWEENDYYDISLQDGSNLPISIYPTDSACPTVRCEHDFNQDCPDELRKKNGNGQTVGCMSACTAFQTDEYCCAGAHNTPETCMTSESSKDYNKFFKDRCPDAMTKPFDYRAINTCGNTDYRIVFT